MRQATKRIEKALRNGLRRYSNNPRGTPGLIECFNMAPGAQGLEAHETITDLNADGVSWGGLGKFDLGYIEEDSISTDSVSF